MYHHKPLYHEMVVAVRSEAVAGLPVFRGMKGFGANPAIRTRTSWACPGPSNDRSIVDTSKKIERFLSQIEPMIGEGLVPTERIEIPLHRPRRREHA